jgi:putative oxidoreductase
MNHSTGVTIMNKLLALTDFHAALGRALDALRSPLLLATRWYVAWQFLKSGWLKLTSWETTVGLFRDEYRVPVLPPEAAAVAGTAGELMFPLLLIVGLYGRVGALGLFAVNALAVIAYAHVLLGEGFEAALGQHVLWGFMLLVLAIVGGGRLSLDTVLERRSAARCRPAVRATAAASSTPSAA